MSHKCSEVKKVQYFPLRCGGVEVERGMKRKNKYKYLKFNYSTWVNLLSYLILCVNMFKRWSQGILGNKHTCWKSVNTTDSFKSIRFIDLIDLHLFQEPSRTGSQRGRWTLPLGPWRPCVSQWWRTRRSGWSSVRWDRDQMTGTRFKAGVTHNNSLIQSYFLFYEERGPWGGFRGWWGGSSLLFE